MEQASTWKTPPPVSRSECDSRSISDRSDQIDSNKINGRTKQPRFLSEPRLLSSLTQVTRQLVKLDPALTAPVTAALMFTPPETVARTPGPVVRMDGHAGVSRIVVRSRGVPAHIFAAHDRGRRPECRKRQNTGARSRAEKNFSHLQPPYVSVGKERRSRLCGSARGPELSRGGGHPVVVCYRVPARILLAARQGVAIVFSGWPLAGRYGEWLLSSFFQSHRSPQCPYAPKRHVRAAATC